MTLKLEKPATLCYRILSGNLGGLTEGDNEVSKTRSTEDQRRACDLDSP